MPGSASVSPHASASAGFGCPAATTSALAVALFSVLMSQIALTSTPGTVSILRSSERPRPPVPMNPTPTTVCAETMSAVVDAVNASPPLACIISSPKSLIRRQKAASPRPLLPALWQICLRLSPTGHYFRIIRDSPPLQTGGTLISLHLSQTTCQINGTKICTNRLVCIRLGPGHSMNLAATGISREELSVITRGRSTMALIQTAQTLIKQFFHNLDEADWVSRHVADRGPICLNPLDLWRRLLYFEPLAGTQANGPGPTVAGSSTDRVRRLSGRWRHR